MDLTSNWLSTFRNAHSISISPMSRFSSALLTGPLKVTRPSFVMIFTFLALTDILLASPIPWRIEAVVLMSSALFP